MRIRAISTVVGLVLIASACSSSDSGETATDNGSTGTASPTTAAEASSETTAPQAPTTTAPSAPPAGGGGTATVTLENGEAYTFSIICGLEPQESAGSEILFTAVSNDTPYGFDVTQFGELAVDSGGLFDGIGSITIWDSATYDDIWAAGSVFAQLDGSEFVLELNGTTITGRGMFLEGGDLENIDAAVPGGLVAECG